MADFDGRGDGSADSSPPSSDTPIAGVSPAARLLRAGKGLHADLRLVDASSGPQVVKDYGGRASRLRRAWGRWICAREQAVYKAMEARLGPSPWRPRLIGPSGAHAFLLSYRPGRPLSRALAAEVPADFVDALEGAVSELHAGGIVHLDLSHRSNVLVDDSGGPVLLDFASALTAPPGGLRHRLLLFAFAGLDRRALRKWRRKLGHDRRARAASPAQPAVASLDTASSEAPAGGSDEAGASGSSAESRAM